MFVGTDWEEKRAATIRGGIMGMFALYKILKGQRRAFSRLTSVLHFLKTSSGTHTSPSALLAIEHYDPREPAYTSRGSASSLNCIFLKTVHPGCSKQQNTVKPTPTLQILYYIIQFVKVTKNLRTA